MNKEKEIKEILEDLKEEEKDIKEKSKIYKLLIKFIEEKLTKGGKNVWKKRNKEN